MMIITAPDTRLTFFAAPGRVCNTARALNPTNR